MTDLMSSIKRNYSNLEKDKIVFLHYFVHPNYFQMHKVFKDNHENYTSTKINMGIKKLFCMAVTKTHNSFFRKETHKSFWLKENKKFLKGIKHTKKQCINKLDEERPTKHTNFLVFLLLFSFLSYTARMGD